MELVFGSADGVGSSLGKYAVMTQDIPWKLVGEKIGAAPQSVNMISSLDAEVLDAIVRGATNVDTVVGVGGGMCIDAAKYFAWKRKCAAVFVPTIVSVDAYATPMAGVRRDGRVSYEGDVTPERIIIDFRAVQSAPKKLNRAGCGDVFSCKTALFDWELAKERTGESWHEEAAEGARNMLRTLVSKSADIKEVTEEGIRTLVKLHLESWRVQKLAQSPRPQEGSEHVYFYSLEEVSGKAFLHGSAVGTGIYAMRYFQTGDHEATAEIMDGFGLGYRPADYGLTKDEFTSALLHMRTYSSYPEYKKMVPYTILDEVKITRQDAERIWERLS